jgi:hypothetical protein
MKIIGQGHVEFFNRSDELLHPAPKDDWWNESVWLQFLDSESHVYGAIRIGHQPNWQSGVTSIWSLIGTAEWIYKRDGLYGMTDGDRAVDGFGANGTHSFRFDGRCHWRIEDEDISVELVTEDFHPPFGLSSGVAMENIAKGHFEAAGRISGTVMLRGRKFVIGSGLAYRDHSWGVRFWHHMRVHRFTASTFGPDFSCNAICFYDETDRLSQWGYVRRGDEIHLATEVEVIAYMEADGISNRGGVIRYALPGGEELYVECRPVNKGMISRQHTLAINDTICWARCNGRVGAGVFETNSNTQGGSILPSQRGLVRTLIDNGIHAAGAEFSGFFPAGGPAGASYPK